MIYHRRNKKKTNKKVVTIIVILALLFLFGSTIKSLVQFTAVPVITVKNIITYPFAKTIEQFHFKEDLIDENEELKKENRRLEIENLTVESLKRENESLKKLTGYVENLTDYHIGKVLNQPPLSPYDTFIIDLGSEDVVIDDNVYYLGVLIGKIEEVYMKTSVVRLLSSPGQSLFVSISEQETEAIGIGGGGFTSSLPKDFTISEQEVIFVNQKPIGRVDSIEFDETGAFQKVYFRYPFNINDVDFVEVGLKN